MSAGVCWYYERSAFPDNLSRSCRSASRHYKSRRRATARGCVRDAYARKRPHGRHRCLYEGPECRGHCCGHRLCFHLSSHADSSNAPSRRSLRTTSDALVCLTVGYRLVLQKSRSLPSALRRTLTVSLAKAKQVYNKALETQAAERWRASKRGRRCGK